MIYEHLQQQTRTVSPVLLHYIVHTLHREEGLESRGI